MAIPVAGGIKFGPAVGNDINDSLFFFGNRLVIFQGNGPGIAVVMALENQINGISVKNGNQKVLKGGVYFAL
jgi:hypothetical protein